MSAHPSGNEDGCAGELVHAAAVLREESGIHVIQSPQHRQAHLSAVEMAADGKIDLRVRQRVIVKAGDRKSVV